MSADANPSDVRTPRCVALERPAVGLVWAALATADEPLRSEELVAATENSIRTVRKAVNTLEQRGLVDRKRAIEDGDPRVILYDLTDRAEALLEDEVGR